MSDILVNHLCRAAYVMFKDGYQSGTLAEQAADEITRLRAALADERKRALEEAAKVAERFGADRPLAERRPTERIMGRWEGEQASSIAIAAAIRALKEPTK